MISKCTLKESPEMRLALLMTNTDESAFAQAHPKDGEKFAQLIQSVRPTWEVTSYSVKDGVFPSDIATYDGVMISGSPTSVHDTDPWIEQLLQLIRDIYSQGLPIFGACFGHQAIALALGGQVGPNPGGWVFGLTHSDIVHKTSWMQDLPATLKQYGAHIEQVLEMPKTAVVISSNSTCPVAGFHIEGKVYTTQNHPEMTPEFVAALVAEYTLKLPADVAATAKSSIAVDADTLVYAHSIAQFFENAVAP
jgi:GMP synthase-like glutamine amidotransferase|tara:strand:+ start:3648 stop:4397 length:750 start_codon:yes stop_codon:yes gene_type:complete